MDYEHDIFISYRREENWTRWTRDHFRRVLSSYLQNDLTVPPRIFVDEQIEPGSSWVSELGTHLAKSKIVVAVMSGDYFSSPWCLHELDLIVGRCHSCKDKDMKLVIPVIVHDGDRIPNVVQKVQSYNLSAYWNTHPATDSPQYSEFSEKIKALAPAVAKAINHAPEFNPKWVNHHCKRFEQVFKSWKAKRPTLKTKTFPVPQPPATSKRVPRLRP